MTSFGLMGVSLAGTPTNDAAYTAWQNAVLPAPPYTGIQARRVYYSGIPTGPVDSQIQNCIDNRYKACVSFNPTMTGTRTSANLPSLAQMQTDQTAMVAALNTIVTAFTTAGMTPISSFLSVTMAHEPTDQGKPQTSTPAQFQNAYGTAASGGLTNYAALHAICPVWVDLIAGASTVAGAASYFPGPTAANPGATLFCDGFAVDYYAEAYGKNVALSNWSTIADFAHVPFSIWETADTTGPKIPHDTVADYLSFLASFFAGRIASSLPIGEILWWQANGANPGYNIISSASDYRVPYLQAINVVLNPASPPPPPPPPPPPLPGPGGPVNLTYGPPSALDAVLSAANTGQGSLWPAGPAVQFVALDPSTGSALMPNPTTIPSTLVLQGTPPLMLPSGTAGWVMTSDGSGNLNLAAPAGGLNAMAQLATTGNSGYTLVNGTGTIFSWTAPNDGNIHRVLLIVTLNVTTAETGGQLQLAATNPAGGAANQSFFNSQTTGSKETLLSVNVQANTTVTLTQNTALTAGAAVLYAELWGS